jgi:hypothetical protein
METYNLFILGSPNAADGVLSPISQNRIAKAIELQKAHPEIILLATGGFGNHFNISPVPHRELVHQRLLEQNALINATSPEDFLSSNTVEDAIMITQFSISHETGRFGIVTSKFHMARCRYIFECLASKRLPDFFMAEDPSDLGKELVRHEESALAQLVAQGGILIDNSLHRHDQPA